MTEFALLTLISLLLVGALVHSSLKRDLGRLALLEKWAAKYSKSMNELTALPDLPPEAIKSLKFWNRAVRDKRSPAKFAVLFALAHTRINNETSPENTELQNYSRGNPDFATRFIAATVSAMMVISYKSRIWGLQMRSGFADVLAEHHVEKIERFTRATERKLKLVPQPAPDSEAA
jgi:hypothetical protein